jgi:hypothetical protein
MSVYVGIECTASARAVATPAPYSAISGKAVERSGLLRRQIAEWLAR